VRLHTVGEVHCRALGQPLRSCLFGSVQNCPGHLGSVSYDSMAARALGLRGVAATLKTGEAAPNVENGLCA